MRFFEVLFFLLSVAFVAATFRDIKFDLNPGCDSCDKPYLYYGKGQNLSTTLHYFWSGINCLTFIIVEATTNAEVIIDWGKLKEMKEDSIHINPRPLNIFGLSFQNLILFNDKNGTGTLKGIPVNETLFASLSDFDWFPTFKKDNSSGDWNIKFSANTFREEPIPNNGTVTFDTTVFSMNGMSNQLPHLLTTSTSSQVNIILDELLLDLNETIIKDQSSRNSVPISGFEYPRWAVDFIFFANKNPNINESFSYSSHKSLDDEFAPGVFDLNDVQVAENSSSSGRSFMQWRPVAYLTPGNNINYATTPTFDASFPPLDEKHLNATYDTLVNVFFRDDLKDVFIASQSNVSFGRLHDGFYTKFNYTQWTLSFGLGAAPTETFSMMVLVIIFVGCSVPILFLIGGCISVAVIKYKKRKYDQLN